MSKTTMVALQIRTLREDENTVRKSAIERCIACLKKCLCPTQASLAYFATKCSFIHPLVLALLLLMGLSLPSVAYAKQITSPHAVQNWLPTLAPKAQERGREVLAKWEPKISALQMQIRQKLAELRALRYDTHASVETLPRLGKELQELRSELKEALSAFTYDVYNATGQTPPSQSTPQPYLFKKYTHERGLSKY